MDVCTSSLYAVFNGVTSRQQQVATPTGGAPGVAAVPNETTPMSCSRLLQSLLSLLVACHASVAFAQEPPPEPELKPAGRQARDAKIARRDQLWEQARSLAKDGKTEEALKAGEQVLSLNRQIHGESTREVGIVLQSLAYAYFSNSDTAKARQKAAELLTIKESLRGKEHYETIDARWQLDYYKRMGTVDLQLRKKMQRLETDYRKFYSAAKYPEAIAAARKLVPLEEQHLGTEHPYLANTLVGLVNALLRAKQLADAEAVAERALGIRRKQLGDKHPDSANAAWQVTESLLQQRKYNDALSAIELEKTLDRASGKHESAAWAESARGRCLTALRRKDEAIAAFRASLASFRKLKHPRGEAHQLRYLAALDSSVSLKGQHSRLWREARTASSEDRLADATSYAERALALERVWLGNNHSQTSSSLKWLADAYEANQEWSKAEGKRREHLGRLTESLGKKHWKVTDARLAMKHAALMNSLTNQQRLELREATRLSQKMTEFYRAGKYAEAIQSRREALRIQQRILGPVHPLLGKGLNDLGALQRLMGDYAKAEPLLTRSCEIKREALGEDHPSYADTLHNIAVLHEMIGNYAKAEPLLLRCQEIRREALGEDHPDYATTLLSLAWLYKAIGNYAKAEPFLLQCRKIRRKTLGEDHPDYAQSLHNLATLYMAMGNYAKAEPLLLESRETHGEALGVDHPNYAMTLFSIARLYKARGNLAKAEPLLLECREIQREALGEDHPSYAVALHYLATLYRAMGNLAKAEQLSRAALRISRNLQERSAIILSERQQIAMGQKLREKLAGYVSLALQFEESKSSAARQLLQLKGSTLVRQRAMRLAAADPAVADRFRGLQVATRQLSSLARTSPGSDVQSWRDRLSKLTSRKERLEAELSRDSTAFREAQKRVAFEEIQGSVPEDGVLVDYLQYRRSRPSENKGKWDYETSLLATLVSSHREPILVDLGAVGPLNEAIETWRSSFGMSDEGRAAGQLLRERIWEPLLEHIGNARTVLVSTDGVLGRLPLGALPGKEPGTYLLEDHRLAMIPVPQLLPSLVSETGKKELSRELLLMGGVDYDAEPADAAPAKKRRRRAARGDEKFGRLPGTAGEVATIAETFRDIFEFDADDISTLKGAGATEARFRELAPQFYHLHLATHGFFASADKKSALSSEAIEEADRRSSSGRGLLATRDEVVVGLNPGLLSGLAFSGANREPQPDQDDGILTAQEIAFLPLNAVDTVVLSACETGLGPVAGGEGLLGVQRAFQVAGVRSTIASLWKVDDLVTRQLMERFYRNLWEKEMSRLDALREAQLWVLNNPGALRGATLTTDDSGQSEKPRHRTPPKYWAAFVLSGDWR